MNAEMLYQVLLADIEGGKLPLDRPMPTEAALCEKYGLARGTVRVALNRLAVEGYVRAGQGRKRIVQQREPVRLARLRVPSKDYEEPAGRRDGTRAGAAARVRVPSFGEYMRSIGQHPSDIVLRSPAEIPCYKLAEETRFGFSPAANEALAIGPEDKVLSLLRLRLANDKPLVLQWAVIPADLIPRPTEDLQDFLVPGGLTRLYKEHGIARARVDSTYAPTLASRMEAAYFGLGAGAPLIEERRISYFVNLSSGGERAYEFLLCLYCERVALTFAWEDGVIPRQAKTGPTRARTGERGHPEI